jgi:hypothetical protein
LCDEYSAKLFEADFDVFPRMRPTASDTFGPRSPLTAHEAALSRRTAQERGRRSPEPPNPFAGDTGEAFIKWLRESEDPIGGAATISRYLQKVRLEVPKLAEQFFDVRWISADDYLEWVRRHGWREQKIPQELRPPRQGASQQEAQQRMQHGREHRRLFTCRARDWRGSADARGAESMRPESRTRPSPTRRR